ncbi:hypothetical protein MHL31_10480 [Lutibacter sp. A80]|nr:hypothetical protein [Lutibacter sp. A80]UMB59504.1 hypothetical protein MHL31_10480 [Lutibacter sp. A80]
MKHSNTVKDNISLSKENFSYKAITNNNLSSKETYCEQHAIADYYCETK